ncbi:Hypothetical protein, partial CDS, partial [Neorhizobium galegae bv. orientalis]
MVDSENSRTLSAITRRKLPWAELRAMLTDLVLIGGGS